jgi:uncharacterized protein YndB with AHSA1/START domain
MTSDAQPGPRILGSLRAENGKGAVRMEDRFDTDIEDVWSALTEPERLARWLGTVEGDLRVGGRFHKFFYASGSEGPGRVDVCEPPHRFVVTLDPDAEESHVVEVTLRTDGDQTVLVLDEKGMPVHLLAAYGAGIQIHGEDLGAHLAQRDRCDANARWDELEPAYDPLAADV